ncbi:MAG: PAS domain S-box protein [Deltaproteobacteria bacterium]|nr:PAS domain S-box protein [Deltaproteobacteria bacterium]
MNSSPKIRHGLALRLIFWVWLILFVSFGAWFYLHLKYDRRRSMENMITGVDRLAQAIVLSTGQAMVLNARKDITPMLVRLSEQQGIDGIRIYAKDGKIKHSSRPGEIGTRTNIKAEACDVCHQSDPPLSNASLQRRTRTISSPERTPLLGVITPIYRDKGCGIKGCHDTARDKKVLGALDILVSLEQINRQLAHHRERTIAFALAILLATGGVLALFIIRFVRRPIEKLVSWTRHIAEGDYDYHIEVQRGDEIGQLARAIREMGRQIGEKQEELNKQKEAYQNLFELAPCYITVQDKDFKLLAYNREFAEHFDPKPGDYCYRAYKGRSERCEICPVAQTFEDGRPHTSEETGINKDGTRSFWMVRTAPLRDAQGKVIAAMEMSLDVTKMKFLEDEVRKSEEKYRVIFDTIPNPVFLVDERDLRIIDCNNSIKNVYGFDKEDVLGKPFTHFFEEGEREQYEKGLRARQNLNKVRQIRKDGSTIYANIRISSSREDGTGALLVTVIDITEQLIAEQKLVQASKMATLGEMATGIAHELNQPLSVIKTASNLILKKVRNKEPIKEEVMETLAEEMDSQVDRASKIINHLREFGRQADVKKKEVQVNDVLMRALDIFSQQLKLRGIEVIRDMEKTLPPIMADSNRLEQVFINLLTNARDAIEERQEREAPEKTPKQIRISTRVSDGSVVIEVEDTGSGIPEKIRDRIFDPFFTTKKVGKGTGLGLAISYGIIRDYDGTIDVKSRVNEGSTFIVNFPVPGKSK